MSKHKTFLGPKVEEIIRKYHAVDNNGFITAWNPVDAAREIDALYRAYHETLPSKDGQELAGTHDVKESE